MEVEGVVMTAMVFTCTLFILSFRPSVKRGFKMGCDAKSLSRSKHSERKCCYMSESPAV